MSRAPTTKSVLMDSACLWMIRTTAAVLDEPVQQTMSVSRPLASLKETPRTAEAHDARLAKSACSGFVLRPLMATVMAQVAQKAPVTMIPEAPAHAARMMTVVTTRLARTEHATLLAPRRSTATAL